MSWLALITGLVQFLGALAKWAGDKQLIDAGAATAVSEGQSEILANLGRVKAAREVLADTASGRAQRLRDKHRRD